MTPVLTKNTARLRLATGCNPQKTVLIYAGITLGGSFLTLLFSFFVGLLMEDTGGLSGLDTRAWLETLATVAQLLVRIATPLLSMGFLHGALLLAREKAMGPKTLLVGLKRWGLLLRHTLFQGLILLCLGYLSLQVATVVFTFLPGAQSAMALVESLVEDPAVLSGNLTDAQLVQMVKAFAPAYMIAIVLFVAAFIPVSYRLRLSDFRVMEETPVGAIKATVQSFRLMKGSCMALFKLDLSFWWFYLLQGALTVAVVILGALPQVSDLAYIIGYGVYCLALLLLEYKCLAYVQTTYAVFYQNLLEKANAPTHPQIEE